jgi:hypothetical protein
MTTLISPEGIQALGFEWPGLPILEKTAVMVGGAVDLTATLARLEGTMKFYEGEMNAAYAFSRQWNAPMDDVTDRMGEYAEGVRTYGDAVRRVRAILAARNP